MAYNYAAITEFKDGSTPATGTLALGSLFEAEFDQLYGNWQNFFGTAGDTLTIDNITEKTTDAGITVSDIKKINGTYYIETQAQFTAIIEQVSGSQYQFIDDVVSVIFDNLSGGYQMPDDDYYLQTNNCKSIEMRGGAFLDFNDGIGYLEVNTDDCYLRNVNIQGDGSSGAVVQSFLLNAYRATFDNCKCSTRNSSVDMVGFQGSGTAAHNITSKYVNCSAYALDGADKIYGFKDCYNLQNCLAYDIDSTVDRCFGFVDCYNLNNCIAYDIESSNEFTFGFEGCYNLSNCYATNISATAALQRAIGFYNCKAVSSCYVDTVEATTGYAVGITACEGVSGCYVNNISCTTGIAAGFGTISTMYSVSGCYSENISTSGAGTAYGFYGIQTISSCYATNISTVGGTDEGISNCDYGAALYTSEATNSGNDWIDTVDAQITNKVSTPSIWT